VQEYLATVQSLTEEESQGYGVMLLPVMAQALVPVYNLPELAAANKTLVPPPPPRVLPPSAFLPHRVTKLNCACVCLLGEQVLDGLTLGDIWSGSIVWWNDTAIQNLNPTATMPHARIQLVYANDTLGSISGAFGDALSVFNSDFAVLWSAANATLYAVVETLDLAVNTGSPGALQPITVKNTPYGLGYSTLAVASANGATSALMKNKAGARSLICSLAATPPRHSELTLASRGHVVEIKNNRIGGESHGGRSAVCRQRGHRRAHVVLPQPGHLQRQPVDVVAAVPDQLHRHLSVSKLERLLLHAEPAGLHCLVAAQPAHVLQGAGSGLQPSALWLQDVPPTLSPYHTAQSYMHAMAKPVC
jgi:hypothetical protein